MHWRDRDWLAKYLPERRNVLVALVWACAERDPDVLALLVAALAELDTVTYPAAAVVRLVVPMDSLGQASPKSRARALLELGWARYLDGHRELGTELS